MEIPQQASNVAGGPEQPVHLDMLEPWFDRRMYYPQFARPTAMIATVGLQPGSSIVMDRISFIEPNMMSTTHVSVRWHSLSGIFLTIRFEVLGVRLNRDCTERRDFSAELTHLGVTMFHVALFYIAPRATSCKLQRRQGLSVSEVLEICGGERKNSTARIHADTLIMLLMMLSARQRSPNGGSVVETLSEFIR